jgi:Reverse transcriptase (RNA-dependent DNA polymerase)
MSKHLEHLVAAQLVRYLEITNLLPPLQSGFRPRHSVLHVFSDILEVVDRGNVAALALQDLSVAFDTVDYDILIGRLQKTNGISGKALRRFQSYLGGRKQSVRRVNCCSDAVAVICGVAQGSVLRPLLFALYTTDIAALVQNIGLVPHLFADDSEVYGWSPPAHVDDMLKRLSA